MWFLIIATDVTVGGRDNRNWLVRKWGAFCGRTRSLSFSYIKAAYLYWIFIKHGLKDEMGCRWRWITVLRGAAGLTFSPRCRCFGWNMFPLWWWWKQESCGFWVTWSQTSDAASSRTNSSFRAFIWTAALWVLPPVNHRKHAAVMLHCRAHRVRAHSRSI